ncbi:MAG: hypothetical protein ACTSXJ_06450 [Candidatus Baldrarchaeia archaeon]
MKISITDSSSMAMRACAAALRGEILNPIEVSLPERLLLPLVSRSRKLLRVAVDHYLKRMSVPRSALRFLTEEDFALFATSIYNIPREKKFKYVVMGAPSGAVSHLAAMLHAPFLSHSFLLRVKAKKRKPEDFPSVLKSASSVALNLCRTLTNAEVVIHYDPVHDRSMLRFLDTVRVKLLQLPIQYIDFIKRHLHREGTVILVECTFQWYRYQTDDRIFVQIGGFGGIGPDEYIYGSDRLDRWLEGLKSRHKSGWSITDMQQEVGRESEWGSPPQFIESARNFCIEEGIDLLVLRSKNPFDLSSLVFYTFLSSYCTNSNPITIYIDSFTATNPTFNLKTCTAPLWIPYVSDNCFSFLKEFLRRLDPGIKNLVSKIFLTLFPTMDTTPDLVPLDMWLSLLSDVSDVHLVGNNRKFYPLDPGFFIRYPSELRKLLKRFKRSLTQPVDAEDVVRVCRKAGIEVRKY